jgi:hypothetical protein
MADNLTQSDPNHPKDLALQAEDAHDYQPEAATSALQSATQPPIIWTPRFIIIFFLLLVIGLSGASMLTRGWLNKYYPAGWVLIAYTVLNLVGWISVSKYARSPWVRLGGTFGCLWAILMGFAFALSVFPIDPDTIMLAHTTAAASSALLASFICLSIARTPLQDWDRTLFLLAPIAGGILATALFLHTPDKMRSFLLLEEYIATVELWLCTAIWWLRSSCWRTQAGPAFLLGIAPVIQITLTQPVNSNSESVFFFSQVMLLSLLLGTLRILQCELRH